MKSYRQHIESLRTLAYLAGKSSDLDMRAKQATLEWLANEWAELERERDALHAEATQLHDIVGIVPPQYER